ncbi:MAG: hypothetical protein QW701_01075 [Candidatus Nezhaarchaeales archaeon]
MKLGSILIASSVVLLIVLVPLYVYLTYPNVQDEEEALLEGSVTPVASFRPPKFLIGSIVYGSAREVIDIHEPTIERFNNHLVVKFNEVKKCFLLLAPAYREAVSGKVMSGSQVAGLIVQEGSIVKIAVFKTSRGLFSVVLEVQVGSERYVIASKGR